MVSSLDSDNIFTSVGVTHLGDNSSKGSGFALFLHSNNPIDLKGPGNGLVVTGVDRTNPFTWIVCLTYNDLSAM